MSKKEQVKSGQYKKSVCAVCGHVYVWGEGRKCMNCYRLTMPRKNKCLDCGAKIRPKTKHKRCQGCLQEYKASQGIKRKKQKKTESQLMLLKQAGLI